MNILITGANGFIGSNIYALLKEHPEYTLFKGTRDVINLHSYESVFEYLQTYRIDSIIHCAIEGGRRNIKDTESIVYNNILMAQNLMSCKITGPFINIASGAEFDRRQDIFNIDECEIYNRSPSDYYGLSKNIISKLINQIENGINIRIFGCFNHNENADRMIRANINKYIAHEPIIIHQDRYMDFIYIRDLYDLVNSVLKFPEKHYRKKDINAVYLDKYKLSDIADMINNLDIHKVPVIIENEQLGKSYCGSGEIFSQLRLNCIGLKNGLHTCYKTML